MVQEATVSIRPSAFTQGGGLLDDADVTIKQARWVLWDYQGKAKMSLAAQVVYVDDEGKEYDQYYSAGDADSFHPGPNGGKTLVKVGTREALSASTNFYQFITSVANAGLTEDEMPEGSDISFLDGLRVHVKREAQPPRPGLKQDPNARDKTVLCINRIISRPGEAKGAKGKGAATKAAVGGKANGKSAATAAVDTALDDKATDAVLAVLATAEGPIPKSKLSSLIFNQFKTDPDCKALVQYAFKDAFLGAEGKPWTFDGQSVSMEAAA